MYSCNINYRFLRLQNRNEHWKIWVCVFCGFSVTGEESTQLILCIATWKKCPKVVGNFFISADKNYPKIANTKNYIVFIGINKNCLQDIFFVCNNVAALWHFYHWGVKSVCSVTYSFNEGQKYLKGKRKANLPNFEAKYIDKFLL